MKNYRDQRSEDGEMSRVQEEEKQAGKTGGRWGKESCEPWAERRCTED